VPDLKQQLYQMEQYLEAVLWLANEPHIQRHNSLRLEAQQRAHRLASRIQELKTILTA
jgi:hypothetical protein